MCDYEQTFIDDSSVQGSDKENYSVGGGNSNMCKDVVIEMELIQLHVENDLHVKLESGLQYALDVLIDEQYENVEFFFSF